jgi:uncharacterized protein (TIGR02145 family)
LYFAFGEPKGYTAKQVRSDERKFNENEYTNVNFDSVKAYWGGKWRMPTANEFRALFHVTTSKWLNAYQGNGVNGRLFTDETDSSKKLFFPAVGHGFRGIIYNAGFLGYYWSSSLDINDSSYGMKFNFDNTSFHIDYDVYFLGFSIRGVISD